MSSRAVYYKSPLENNYKLRKNENPPNGLKYGVGISELAVLTHIPFCIILYG
jgi:hypothetical protein